MSGKPDRHLVLKLAVMGVAMFAFGFALVPLYDVFCSVTGYGGKTASAATTISESPDVERTVRVEFLGSTARGAAWQFEPAVSHMDVHPGQLYEAHYRGRNLVDRTVVGQAVPSIAPGSAAKYFHKTECFCFASQEYGPLEERDLKLVFMVDKELPAYVDTLSLAYTYFDVSP
jgi:cytochrome c oxidase assembly protein subunit 11